MNFITACWIENLFVWQLRNAQMFFLCKYFSTAGIMCFVSDKYSLLAIWLVHRRRREIFKSPPHHMETSSQSQSNGEEEEVKLPKRLYISFFLCGAKSYTGCNTFSRLPEASNTKKSLSLAEISFFMIAPINIKNWPEDERNRRKKCVWGRRFEWLVSQKSGKNFDWHGLALSVN